MYKWGTTEARGHQYAKESPSHRVVHEAGRRGYLGALIGQVSPDLAEKLGVDRDLRAPFVTNVSPGEPAERAGVKPYDVILSVNGKRVHSPSDLVSAITAIPVGDTAKLHISRGGKDMDVAVRVGKRPDGGVSKLPSRKIPSPSRIDAGMDLEALTPETARRFNIGASKGVLVTSVDAGGPADRAGLGTGDVILEVDRKSVADPDEFYSIVKEKKSYLLRVLRTAGGQDTYAVVILDLKE